MAVLLVLAEQEGRGVHMSQEVVEQAVPLVDRIQELTATIIRLDVAMVEAVEAVGLLMREETAETVVPLEVAEVAEVQTVLSVRLLLVVRVAVAK
jgi:hypothetical protein